MWNTTRCWWWGCVRYILRAFYYCSMRTMFTTALSSCYNGYGMKHFDCGSDDERRLPKYLNVQKDPLIRFLMWISTFWCSWGRGVSTLKISRDGLTCWTLSRYGRRWTRGEISLRSLLNSNFRSLSNLTQLNPCSSHISASIMNASGESLLKYLTDWILQVTESLSGISLQEGERLT